MSGCGKVIAVLFTMLIGSYVVTAVYNGTPKGVAEHEAAVQARNAAAQAQLAAKAKELRDAIAGKKIFIGMTADNVRESWGNPTRVNRTVNANTIHEQWVYRGTCVYFVDGVMTSFQDSK